MNFTRICCEYITFEPGKCIVDGQFKKINSFSKILSANVWSAIISTTPVVRTVINIKQIKQKMVNENGPEMDPWGTRNNIFK